MNDNTWEPKGMNCTHTPPARIISKLTYSGILCPSLSLYTKMKGKRKKEKNINPGNQTESRMKIYLCMEPSQNEASPAWLPLL